MSAMQCYQQPQPPVHGVALRLLRMCRRRHRCCGGVDLSAPAWVFSRLVTEAAAGALKPNKAPSWRIKRTSFTK
jgi:hypothetical protein